MTAQREHQLVPTVSRIVGDTIVELVYDPHAHTTALAVHRSGSSEITSRFEASTGETHIPFLPTNNLIRHQCVQLPSAPAPYGTKEALLRDIESYIHRYVDLSPAFERIAAHYVLLSWVHDAFNEVPYLRFKGDYGSGKTRALLALGSIAYRGFFASGASTVSPIFHTLDTFGGTLVLDEGDLRFSDKTADLVKILNNGTVKGLPVLRTLQNRQKEFSPAAFAVFGPKIVAMRGMFRDIALESRFLTEDMGIRPLRSDVPIELRASLRAEALALRNRLLDFRFATLFRTQSNPARLIAGIDPRLNQMALPLLSLMDDDALRDEFAGYLRRRHVELSQARVVSAEALTLAALNEAFRADKRPFIPLAEIAARTNVQTDGNVLTPRQIGRVLREHSVRLHKSHGTITVPRTALGAF